VVENWLKVVKSVGQKVVEQSHYGQKQNTYVVKNGQNWSEMVKNDQT
jgi:hypothetical protein